MTSNPVGHPIVAGVDGSVSASNAAGWAAEDAALRRLPLRLVHAVNVYALTGASLELLHTEEADGRQRLNETRAAIRGNHAHLDIQLELGPGDPVTTLIEESTRARLVVLGSRGLGGFSGMLAGSTAVALAAHGHCPVAVIHARTPHAAPPTTGPVVVGVDGSPTSEQAIAVAFEEASLRGAGLVAVHTWLEYASDAAYAYARQFAIDWERAANEEHELLAQRLAGWQQKYPDVVVRRVVTQGRPVRALLEQSATARLLVVGSRGRGGFAGMLLGSTSQALTYHAPCPLLVVRPTAMR